MQLFRSRPSGEQKTRQHFLQAGFRIPCGSGLAPKWSPNAQGRWRGEATSGGYVVVLYFRKLGVMAIPL